eukprot:symbB.v1.2.019899.t1/scaffold1641.1/size211090/14
MASDATSAPLVARWALSGQLLGSCNTVDELKQQISQQLGVSSYCQKFFFAEDNPLEVQVACQTQVNDFDAELLLAAEESPQQVEELLCNFQDPNCADEMQRTPLPAASLLELQMKASFQFDMSTDELHPLRQLLDCLMAASADLEKASVRGLTALHGAAHGNRVEATQRLLEARQLLLGARAELDCQGEGFTPLHSAVGNGHKEARAVARFIGGACEEVSVGLSALHVASNFSVVQGLLAARAEPNTMVPQLGTPLCCAARAGDVEVVALLLEKSVDLESGELTPLCLAAESGHLEALKGKSTSRLIVRLIDSGDQYAVKPENLRTTEEEANELMGSSLEDVSIYNTALQSEAAKLRESGKLDDLQNDPELKPIFEDIKKNGMGALEKYWEDEKLMAKISKAMGQ